MLRPEDDGGGEAKELPFRNHYEPDFPTPGRFHVAQPHCALTIVASTERIMMTSADESQITNLLHRLRDVTDDLARFADAEQGTRETSSQGWCSRRAASLLRQRQARRRFLPDDLFREPGWDMLLTVYVADCNSHPTNVKALILSVDSPPATAQRWIDHLDRLGLVLRTTDPLDRRRVEVSMTDAGRIALEAYLTAMPEM